jgi:hypothetical protein
MTTLIFIGGIIWGSLSAQFLVQTITSLIVTSICLAALAFSKVPKATNAVGGLVSLVQAIIFASLFFGGNWIAGDYIDFLSWNAVSVASNVSFLATIIYVGRQVPGKILLAKLSAWAPDFSQVVMHRPANERVELARKYRANPTLATLYEPVKSAYPPLQSAPPPQDGAA